MSNMQVSKMKLRQVGMVAGVMSLVLALAASSVAVLADSTAISQGFNVEGDVVVGTLMSVSGDGESSAVRAATAETSSRLVGVVGDKQLIELSDGSRQTQIVTSGTAFALVSDINGEVKIGDTVVPSPIAGVGMKAVESSQVVGTAKADFSDAEQVSDRQVIDRSGVSQTVKIGLIPVQVNVSYWQAPDDPFAFLPPFLQQFANTVAGRAVSPLRVLASLALLVVGCGSAAVLLFSSVRSSIISIGRNPLSARAITRSLFEVGGMAFGILLVMLVAVYLILIV